MMTVWAKNVNDAYEKGVGYLVTNGVREDSRNGPVLVAQTPVTTVYEAPTERVLFNRERDANPFFHLMEAIWMLAGRRDAAFLTRYAKQLGEYAEEDGMIHGAYGHRWRKAFGFDQLNELRLRLRHDPNDRQAVLQMWDCSMPTDKMNYLMRGDDGIQPSAGHLKMGNNDLEMHVWKDRPCNTHAYFRVRTVDNLHNTGVADDFRRSYLDITVCCRSNDAIWGAYGANAVHFSVLQEYVAAAIGVGVGRYYQVSNNFHVYDNDLLKRCRARLSGYESRRYERDQVRPSRLVTRPESFIDECERLCLDVDALWRHGSHPHDKTWGQGGYENEFLENTAWNMALAHYYWKQTRQLGQAVSIPLAKVQADDWRVAGAEWLQRRY